MINETLEAEREGFNNIDYNNQRSILRFIINKLVGRDETCDSCEKAYKRKYCNLCNWIIENQKPSELYEKINQTSHKLKI